MKYWLRSSPCTAEGREGEEDEEGEEEGDQGEGEATHCCLGMDGGGGGGGGGGVGGGGGGGGEGGVYLINSVPEEEVGIVEAVAVIRPCPEISAIMYSVI